GGWKNVPCRLGNSGSGCSGRFVSIKNLRAKSARTVCLGPGHERRVWKRDRLISGRGRRAQGFDTEEKEKLMMRDDRPPDCRRNVVAMEAGIGQPVRELRSSEHILIVKIVADQPVEFVSAGLRGAGHLDRAGSTILRGERVDLDGRLLDKVWIGGQVQDALSNPARDVQPVDNKFVGNCTLTVG